MNTNFTRLAVTAIITCSIAFSCTGSDNQDDKNLNNDPALDTVDIKQDTTNNFPLPLPDSTIHSLDSVAKL